MKRTYLWRIVLITCVISACNRTNVKYLEEDVNSKSITFEIQEVKILQETDTSSLQELRFFDIRSAMDAHAVMYDFYGEFDQKVNSKYQENIKQLIWYEVHLLGDDRVFAVVTDGTETMTNFFSSFIVFDSNEQNCFEDNHPSKEEIINQLAEKMRIIKKKKRSKRYYKKFH